MTHTVIAGGGGGKRGGGGRTPKESPDSLVSNSKARIIDLLSEGEIEGLVDGINSVYLDETPLATNGTPNFEGLAVEWRNGTQDQDPIPGFTAVESSVSQGVEFRIDQPWIRDFTNLELNAVRIHISTPQFYKVDTKNGDTKGHKVEYAIDVSVDDKPFQEVIKTALSGKTTTEYERTHEIVFPSAQSRRTVRVRRLTANANSNSNPDTTYVKAFTELIYGNFSYPNSALIGLEVNAEHFQGIPRRGYDIKGIRVRVPSNYDPAKRTYSGVWDGSFKRAWTDNPAWIFYDLITHTRYGLGDRIPQHMMDKWSLYQIARYCDQMVPDGFGGEEPRFTCNAYIQARENAYDLVQKLASVFQGMAYYAAGTVTAIADQPRDVSATYSNSDVVDGTFTYSGSPKSTRYTVALVGWNNPKNFFKQEIEAVEDRDGLLKYGYQETQFTAFACSSRGQAHRAGKWALLSSLHETQTVVFRVGLKGLKARPGDVIEIADQDLASRHLGGIITGSTISTITVDAPSEVLGAEVGHDLRVTLPSGQVQTRAIASINGQTITVAEPFSEPPQLHGSWLTSNSSTKPQTFRVLSIRESDGEHTYEITGLEYRPDKFDSIANGTKLEPRPIAPLPPGVVPSPTNVTITQRHVFHQGTTRNFADISWGAAEHAVEYDVQWRRDDGEWINAPRTGNCLLTLQDVYAGQYLVRVQAVSVTGKTSVWAYSALTTLDGTVTAPPALTTLSTHGEVMAIRLDWAYPNVPNIIERVQIRASLSNDFGSGYDLTELAYPSRSYTVQGLGYSTGMWFWARLVDKNGEPGPWWPSEGGAGVFGQPDQDAGNILGYLNGKIGESEFTPGLIGDITDTVANGVGDSLIGYLTGDDGDVPESVLWYAGDDGSQGTFVGTVSQTSAINAGDYALAKAINVVAARTDTNEASIAQVDAARADGDSALAQSISTLSARTDTNEAAVQQTSTALATLDDSASASWGVNTEVNQDGRVIQTGVKLGAAIGKNGVARSEFLVRADTVGFLNTVNGQIHTPFVFDVKNDTAFLDTAFIKNATIGNAKIADAAITSIKIKDAEIGDSKIKDSAITNAKIADLAVNTAKIEDLSVTTFKLANGSVTAGGTLDFSLTFGKYSGSNESATLSVNVPGNAAAFIYIHVEWVSTSLTWRILHNGSDEIKKKGGADFDGLIHKSLSSGIHNFHFRSDRPSGGTRTVTGSISVLSWMK